MKPKIHYAVSVLSLLFIGAAIAYFGETNLPPLKPAVRYVILLLYANWFYAYWRLIVREGDPAEKNALWLWAAIPTIFLCFTRPVFSTVQNRADFVRLFFPFFAAFLNRFQKF